MLGIDPPIWRRLRVDSDLTLAQFHRVLQTAMGWQDSHLHEFRIGERTFGRADWEDPFQGKSPPADERSVRLGCVLREIGENGLYTYDFGDAWEHEVVLEDVSLAEGGDRYPVCLEGERHCPPEDCGGVGAYQDLLRVIRDRHHPEYASKRSWLGGKFDPEEFSVDAVNAKLARVLAMRGSAETGLPRMFYGRPSL